MLLVLLFLPVLAVLYVLLGYRCRKKGPEGTSRRRSDQLVKARFRRPKTNMADDRTKVGGQDRQRINLSQDYEVRDWAKSLGATEEHLRMAVAAVGNDADKVREHLKKK